MCEVDPARGSNDHQLGVTAYREHGQRHSVSSLRRLSARQGLAGHLHGLAAFHINNELLIDRLVLHLRVRLHVSQIGSTEWIVAGVADHTERQTAVGAAEQTLAKEALQKRQL